MEKEKLRNWICFSCCFNACGGADDGDGGGERPGSLIRSSSTWLRARVPEIGERWRGLIGRRRRIAGGDFSYDPLSYARNFDEGIEDGGELTEDGFRYRSFSSRLPASPSPSG